MGKTDNIVQRLTGEISSSILPPGRRLPSIRKAAEEFDVSKNTIVEAYDQLAARGLIQAIHGSGFFVATREFTQATPPRQPPHVAEAIDRISLLNAQLDQNLDVRVGDGRPPQSWMQDAIPTSFPKRIFLADDGNQSGYGSAYGTANLREMIALKHHRDDLPIATDQIVTTFGANHALDLIIRRFLEPGDTVMVDDPGYYPLLAKLKLGKINVIGVPRTTTGTDVEALRTAARAKNPKIFFTQSTCQNPTGSSYSLPCAHGVLQAAMQFGFMVVDNDPFADLPSQPGTRLASLDQFNSVVAISTFSKLLSASFRVGYVVAPPRIAKEIAELKLVTTVNSARFSEMIIADMITSQRYQKHLKRLARRLNIARQQYLDRIRDLGLRVFDDAGGGYYSFLMLPDGIDEAELARRAIAKGIFLAPGALFNVDENPKRPAMRVNVTRSDDNRFYRFLKSEVTAQS